MSDDTTPHENAAAESHPSEGRQSDSVTPSWRDERELRVQATPEEAWEAWARPDRIRQWFTDDARVEASGSSKDDASGTASSRIPQAGDELVHVFEGFGEHRYRVLESVPGECLVLDTKIGANAFRQEIRVRRDGGETVISLVHSGFGDPSEGDAQSGDIDSGWRLAFAVLRDYLERHFAVDKTTVTVLRPAAFEFETLRDHFFRGAGLRQWLFDAGGPAEGALLEVGDPVEAVWAWGEEFEGEVLEVTSQEVALRWPSLPGIFELKAFGPSRESRMLGLRATGWGEDGLAVVERRAEMDRAVERLIAAL